MGLGRVLGYGSSFTSRTCHYKTSPNTKFPLTLFPKQREQVIERYKNQNNPLLCLTVVGVWDPVLPVTLSHSKSQSLIVNPILNPTQSIVVLRPASQCERVTGSRGSKRRPSIEREESSFVCSTPIVVNK